MIYQDTLRYLKRKLSTPKKNQEWGGHENFALLHYLQSRYSDTEIEQNSREIKIAFRDFFESAGSLIFRFSLDKGVAFKITPYSLNPQDSSHLQSLITIIKNSRRNIDYPYQGREDQIAIFGRTRRAMNAELAETDEHVNKKALVQFAIKKALGLSDRDVILNQKRKYLIKIFQAMPHLEKEVKAPSEIDQSERRFNGYEPQNLENHYNEFFLEQDLDTFLDGVMAVLFQEKLNFDEISNDYYEKHVLSLIRAQIALELSYYVSQNKNYLIGFAGFIFRKHFMDVHQRMATEIFEQITLKSENAEKFLRYYSGKIYIEGGKRYAIPELTTPDGKHWNSNSVLSIAKMWINSRNKYRSLLVELDNKKEHFKEIEDTYNNKKKQLSLNEEHYKKQSIQARELNNKLENLRYKMREESKGKMDHKLELELQNDEKQYAHDFAKAKSHLLKAKKLRDNDAMAFKKAEEVYLVSQEERSEIEKNLKLLKQNINLNSDSFHSILASLVKALTQRKHLVN
ncbi:MAG: hypothetical protein U9N52_04175 [Campylobacterota bacterium]|nr:hypothetical protein [Campylobacterota bacterium]